MKGKVTQQIFSAVKILLENGATIAEAAKFMKLSEVTVRAIRNSESFTEYNNILAANRKAYAKKKAAEKKAETVTTVTPVTPVTAVTLPKEVTQVKTVNVQIPWQLMQEMKRTNELLTGISNKLAFIVEELTVEVKK